jgi:membrane glycosyltransferase
MVSLAARPVAEQAMPSGHEAWRRGWLPEESPLAMPRQSFGPGAIAEAPPAPTDVPTSPPGVWRRRLILAAGTFALTALVALGPFFLYARDGFDDVEALGMAVFLLLTTPIACWFMSAAMGLRVLLTGREQDDLAFAAHPQAPATRTALLMPLCNEDAQAALGRLADLDASLARLGVTDAFDVFVLSDSGPAIAAAEETAFAGFRLHAHSAAYYRRRQKNLERKAGNIADWVRRFGGAYDFMLVLDADSSLAGETVLRLVQAMEDNPRVGLIQTAPTIVGASTLFARISQFSVRMYGRVAAAGYAWWTGAESSYWGHNAILRVRAFAACAGLPILPGEKPYGGDILSHDVVEAALLRRGGWAVHVTAALDGSCEETPPTLLDFIRRDRRWCQGNLQHLQIVGCESLHPISRLQLVMGAIAYLSSPLWLVALALGLAIELRHPVDWASFWYMLHPRVTPFMLGSVLSAFLLVGPKLMGAALVMRRPRTRRAFGGGPAILKSVAAEMALSAALAPLFMVANTLSVALYLRGRDAGWRPQQREADGLAWADAFRAMRPQMLTGLAFSVALGFRPDLALSFAPIVLPLLLAAPLAVLTSRRRAGEAFARRGLLATPDDERASAIAAVLPGVHAPTAVGLIAAE